MKKPVIVIVCCLVSLSAAVTYLPALPGDWLRKFLFLLNGPLILALYLGYAGSRTKRIASELGVGGLQRARKRGVDVFGVPAYRYRDMLLSINYVRSKVSTFSELADRQTDPMIVLWFPEPLGAPFVVTNFRRASSVLTLNRGLLAYEAKVQWKEKLLSQSAGGSTQLRWAVLDRTTEELLLTDRVWEVIGRFAATVTSYGATFRIEERGIAILVGSGPVDQIMLEKGYELWENLKDKKLPKSSYRPLRSGWNLLVLVLIILVVVAFAALIIAEQQGR